MVWRKARMRSPCAPCSPVLDEWAFMGTIGLMHGRIDLRSLPLEADGVCSDTDRGDEMEEYPPRCCSNEWTIDLIDGQLSRSTYANAVGPLASAEQTRFERYAGALLGWRLLPETVGDFYPAHALIMTCALLRAAEEAVTLPLHANLFFPDHRPRDYIFPSLRTTMTIATTGITFEDTTCFGPGGSGSCAPKCVLRARASGITA
ncbi:hypothetical protein EV714DRAFT_285462 [Schizophyllum commune]